jgi:phosphoserine phosphatase RsbU/P
METTPLLRQADRLDVLIVDDDDMLAEYIAIELESRGCQARSVGSAGEALEVMDDNVDLLITDWNMPGMDGMELVRRVRERSHPDSHLHIVMMTGRDDGGASFAALQAGVDDFLYKPIDAVQLELAVSTARRNRQLHRRLRRRNQLLATAHERTREAFRAVRSDLDAAAKLHERLLPKPERLVGIRAVHLYRPALMLGGDTIGTSDLGGGRTLFFLIDVRGHGVPAALESFHLHHRLKQFRPDSPEALIEGAAMLNREITDRGEDSYATMLAGVIDAPGRQGWILRAGHPPPVLLQGGQPRELEENGSLPLGWFGDAQFQIERFDFTPGDRLVVYSDGLTECIDRRGEAFAAEDLRKLIATTRERPLDDFVTNLEEALDLRARSRHLQDDVSLLALEHTDMGMAEQ